MSAYDIINISLLGLLVLTAIMVVVSRNLMVSTIFLSIFSLIMAATYLVLGAADVAITEAAIGAGISTLLFLSVLLLVGEKEKPHKSGFLPLLVVCITGGALIYATTGFYDFGDPAAITNNRLVPYYLSQSQGEIGIPNVVTSILADYRGFDTLGETFVVFTAAMAVLMLLGGKRKGNKKKL